VHVVAISFENLMEKFAFILIKIEKLWLGVSFKLHQTKIMRVWTV